MYRIMNRWVFMNVVTFTDARNHFKQVLDQVVVSQDITCVHRRDAEDVIMMSRSEWESWQETMHLLSSPVNAERLKLSIQQSQQGKLINKKWNE